MNNEVAKKETPNMSKEALAQLILNGNLALLRPEDKVTYYKNVCAIVGLNPLTKPFDYFIQNGKEVLYANKGCAEQLREIHKVSLQITDVKTLDGVYVVMVKASTPDGRIDAATGAVNIKGLQGENLANAFMKCETKAKRRATLSICGLNMLDEMEVQSIAAEIPPLTKGAENTPPPVQSPTEMLSATRKERTEVANKILGAQKKLKMELPALIEWVKAEFGKDDLKALSLPDMVMLLAQLEREAQMTVRS